MFTYFKIFIGEIPVNFFIWNKIIELLDWIEGW